MFANSDILISVKPKFATRIFDGTKTVELRRRNLQVPAGVRIWIYSTTPVAAIIGRATLEKIIAAEPSAIWDNFGQEAAISKAEFDIYFAQREFAYALVLSGAEALQKPISLDAIKARVSIFHPPQFFWRMNGAVGKLRLNSRKFVGSLRKN